MKNDPLEEIYKKIGEKQREINTLNFCLFNQKLDEEKRDNIMQKIAHLEEIKSAYWDGIIAVLVEKTNNTSDEELRAMKEAIDELKKSDTNAKNGQ